MLSPLVFQLINLDLTPMDAKSWMSKTNERWIEIGVPEFLAKIGIDFESNFLQTINNCTISEDPYPNSKWEIIPHSVIPGGVLHCYPIKIEQSKVTIYSDKIQEYRVINTIEQQDDYSKWLMSDSRGVNCWFYMGVTEDGQYFVGIEYNDYVWFYLITPQD